MVVSDPQSILVYLGEVITERAGWTSQVLSTASYVLLCPAVHTSELVE